jgi:hypothetical protein
VTRSPAVDKNDIVRFKVWRSPDGLLNNRCFGEICFGNGSPPLPNLIAYGDLDGDLHFVLWDEAIVESIPMTDIKKLDRTVGVSQKRERASRRRAATPGENAHSQGTWFDCMQDAIANVGLLVCILKLIGILYNEAKAAELKAAELESSDCIYEDYVAYGKAFKKALEDAIANVGLLVRILKLIDILYNEAKAAELKAAELESSDCIFYEDYVAYGKAFKKALDLNKHSDAIGLPEHLWEPNFSSYHIFDAALKTTGARDK